MSIDASILAQYEKFRIVKQVDGERVTYQLEKQDGFDALGIERWREIRIGDGGLDSTTRMMRDFIIQQATKAAKEQ